MFLKENPLSQCHLDFKASEGVFKFEGYLAIFDSKDQVGDEFLPGAFDDAEGKTYPLFVNHNHKDFPVGQFVGKQDDRGFFIDADINPDHFLGKTVYSGLKRRDVLGLSQGFTAQKEWHKSNDAGGRTFSKVELKEGSVVTFPCEQNALITVVKNMPDDLETLKDFETFLRDAGGFSKSMATAFVSQLAKTVRRDAEMSDSETKSIIESINQIKQKL